MDYAKVQTSIPVCLIAHEESVEDDLLSLKKYIGDRGVDVCIVGLAEIAELTRKGTPRLFFDIRFKSNTLLRTQGYHDPALNVLREKKHSVWIVDSSSMSIVDGFQYQDFVEDLYLCFPFPDAMLDVALTLPTGSPLSGAFPVRLTTELLYEKLTDGILILDGNSRIAFLNKKASELLRLPIPRVLYRSVEEVLQVVHVRADYFSLLPSVETTGSTEWCTLLRHDGSSLAIEKYEQPVLEYNDRHVATLISIRDNSASLEYLSRIEAAKREAEAANKAKASIIANISHDLRTPLNSILGMAQLAFEISNSPQQKEYLRILKLSADSLHNLITSMLEYAKLESGTYRLKEQTFRIKDVLEALSADFAIQCHRKGIGFHIASELNTGASFIGDTVRIRQIINNLVGNSLKFTERGEIVVYLRSNNENKEQGKAAFQNAHCLEVEVTDTGVGIPQDKLWDIFQPFSQLDNAPPASGQRGAGIGLTITRMLVEAMGGKVKVESKPGIGSRFICSVWLKPGAVERDTDIISEFSAMRSLVFASESPGWNLSFQAYMKLQNVPGFFCSKAEDLERILCEPEVGPFILIVQSTQSWVVPIVRRVAAEKKGCNCMIIVTTQVNHTGTKHWEDISVEIDTIFEPINTTEFKNLVQAIDARFAKSDRGTDRSFSTKHSRHITSVSDDRYLTTIIAMEKKCSLREWDEVARLAEQLRSCIDELDDEMVDKDLFKENYFRMMLAFQRKDTDTFLSLLGQLSSSLMYKELY